MQMSRRTLLMTGIGFGASLLAPRSTLGQPNLPANAYSAAQRKFWLADAPREGDPAWNCAAIFFTDEAYAEAGFRLYEREFTAALTFGGQDPAIDLTEDTTRAYRQLRLLNFERGPSYVEHQLIAVQHGRLLHGWSLTVAGDRLFAMEHGIALRRTAKKLIEDREDDLPYYGKDDLFVMLPNLSDLSNSLRLEHDPDEDVYLQDY